MSNFLKSFQTFSDKKKINVIGEVLFDCLENGEKSIAGAPLNFAINLNRLGHTNIELHSSVGNDELGKKAVGFIKLFFTVDTIKTVNSPTAEVRIFSRNGDNRFEIPHNASFDELNFYISNEIVYFGSLAFRKDENFNLLLEIANKGNYFLCDLNLRKPFFEKNRIIEMLKIVDILKINEFELEYLNKIIESNDDIFSTLITQFKIDMIIYTKGENGGLICYKNIEENIIKSEYKAKETDIISTVGAGDSFFAAFIHSLLHQNDIETSALFASEISSKVCNSFKSYI